MDKPKCRLCGEKHWSREPCKAVEGGTSAETELRRRVRDLMAENRDLREQVAALESKEVCTKPHEVGDWCPWCRLEDANRMLADLRSGKSVVSEGRRQYMREYMKRRRAK